MERIKAGQRAALYVRVSTEEQVLHGISLNAQKERLLAFAKENNLIVVDIYEDEGISARKKYKKRPEMCRMLADIERNLIDIVVFIKLDRWFRNIADYYEVQNILDKHNVNWIATEEDYDTTTANGRLHLNIKLSIAQDEADRTSERIKFVFETKRARGELTSGSHPVGFKVENKRLVIDEKTAPIVQALFDEYIKRRSYYEIDKVLKEKYGYNISAGQVKSMLTNEKYRGTIIEGSLFDSVVELRKTKSLRRDSTHVYLFSGFIKCEECGHILKPEFSSSHSHDYNYYACRYSYEKKYHGFCKNKIRVREDYVEKWLLENLKLELENYNLRISQGNAVSVRDTSKIKNKMAKLKDLYLDDLIDRTTYEKEYTAFKKELVQIETANKAILKPVDVDAVATALQAYDKLTQENKAKFWKMLIKNLVLLKDGGFSVVPF